MSKATIIKALGAGLYSVEENFNIEVIEFNVARFRLRQDDIENVDLPQAEQDLTDAEATLTSALDHMNEVIKQLGGKPSQALLNALNTAISDLSTADSTLDLVQTDLLTIILHVNSAQSNLPPGPPPEVTAAFISAFNSLSAAGDSRFNEQQDLHTAQSHLANVLSDVTADPPNLIDAQNELGQLLAQLSLVTSDHVQTVSDINFAKGEVQAARNTLPGDASYDASRADLDEALAVFDANAIPDATSLSALYSDAQNKANSAQDLLSPGRDSVKEELKKALKDLNDARVARADAQFAKDSLDFEFEELDRKINELDAIPKTATKDLWCADLTENIPEKTEVGIMPVPGELNKFRGKTDVGDEAVIRPGFENTHQWNQQRDGWITPCQALTPAATFYNLAMTPGWQVFRPTFRFAKVLKVVPAGTLLSDAVTVTSVVTLKLALIAPNLSSQQLINVTPKDIPQDEFHDPLEITYEAVPVKYMDCDADAFAVGDEVVVEYQEHAAIKARVIGFRKNPKPCAGADIYVPNGKVKFNISSGWTFTAVASPAYANTDWQGTSRALSWKGPRGRYLHEVPQSKLGAQIYSRGALFDTAPGPVIGAAVASFGGVKYLIAVVAEWDGPDDFSLLTRDLFYIKEIEPNPGAWALIGELAYAGNGTDDGLPYQFSNYPVHWFFSASGQAAVSCKELGAVYGPDSARRKVTATFTAVSVSFAYGANFQDQYGTYDPNLDGTTTIPDFAADYQGETQIALSVVYKAVGDGGVDVNRSILCPAQSNIDGFVLSDGRTGETCSEWFLTYLDLRVGMLTYLRTDNQDDGTFISLKSGVQFPSGEVNEEALTTGPFEGASAIGGGGSFVGHLSENPTRISQGYHDPDCADDLGNSVRCPWGSYAAIANHGEVVILRERLLNGDGPKDVLDPAGSLPALTGISSFINDVGVG